LQALFAWTRAVDDDLAASYLGPELFALFQTMSRSDRQHHLRVLRHLLGQERDHPSLMVAALLHDVGKTRVRFTIPERMMAVAVEKVIPPMFERWSRGEARGWRRGFVVSAKHPEWGADMVAAAGGDALAVKLILYHQSRVSDIPDDEIKMWLPYLQMADNAS
jgi:hypothetical protein